MIIFIQMEREVPTKFPQVTLCNLNMFMTKQGHEFVKQVFDKYNLTSSGNVSKPLDEHMIEYYLYRQLLHVNARNNNFSTDYLKNMSLTMDQMLLSCIYNAEKVFFNNLKTN